MKYDEAKRTALKLFGPGHTLKRTDRARRCLVMAPGGMPIGDGMSWLEALRSAGTFHMMKNELKRKEAEQLKDRIEEYVKETGFDVEKLTEKQLEHFDLWMVAKDKGEPTPPAPKTIVESIVKLFVK